MELGRFHAVIADLAEHFLGAKLPEKLQQCATLLSEYASSANTEAINRFHRDVEETIEASVINSLDLRQPFAHQLLETLNLSAVLSPYFGDNLRALIAKESFNPQALAKSLQAMSEEVAQTIDEVSAIHGAGKSLRVSHHHLAPNHAEVGILIPTAVMGEHLSALSDELSQLGSLVQAMNELSGTKYIAPKIVSCSQSLENGFQVYFSLEEWAIAPWITAAERIVALFLSNTDIKNLQRQLKDKDMPKAITDMIEKEVETRVSRAIKELAFEMRKSHAQLDHSERLDEIEIVLREGLYYLARRMNEGATLEINVASSSTQDDNHPAPTETADPRQAQRIRAQKASIATLSIDRTTPLMLADKLLIEEEEKTDEPPPL